jgi:hypothetical protein
MRRKAGLYALGATFSALVFLLGAAACELAFRALDGYELMSLRLKPSRAAAQPAQTQPSPGPVRHAAAVALAPGMKPEWFDLSPAPLSRTPDLNLVAAAEAYTAAGVGPEATHVFNSRFASERLCRDPVFQKFPNFLFLYDAPHNDAYPRYRFPRNAANAAGLVTNQFGWRGPPIELKKAPNTIRIAFVGASTSVNNHGYPFSYPELAGFWLNKWSEDRFGVRIEAINAGREGITSPDIAAVVRDEVLPLEPDLVVYYEGGNQFWPSTIVRLKTGLLPQAPWRVFAYLKGHSAMARRAAEAAGVLARPAGTEPAKPHYEVVWPAGVDENDPPIDHPALPSNLSAIIRDLDSIKANVGAGGGELVATSFFWLVYEGMTLDPVRHRYQLEYLNGTFFPYRYREMERLAAFQNRVFKKYAAVRGLPFLDIAAAVPRDPDLFVDAVHATYPGVRLFAWIAAQQLAPILERRISEARLPRPPRLDLDAHPAFPGNERTEIFDCDAGLSAAIALARIRFANGVTAVQPATIAGDEGELVVEIPNGTPANRYAAMIATPAVARPVGRELVLTGEISVSGGSVDVGVLSPDRARFLVSKSISATAGFVPLRLRVDGTELGSLVVANGKNPDAVTVRLRATELVAMSPLSTRTYPPGLAVPPASVLRTAAGVR